MEVLFSNKNYELIREKDSFQIIPKGEKVSFTGNSKDYSLFPVKSQVVVFETTNACPMGCKYCFISKINEKERLNLLANSKKNVDNLLNFLKRNGELKYDFIFHGGEPLLEKDLIKYVIESVKKDSFLKRSVSFSMQTSGAGMTDEFLDYLLSKRVSIGVSVDSFEKGLRDSTPGLKLLGKLKQRGLKAGVITVVNSSNQSKLFNDFVELVEKFQILGINYNLVFSDNSSFLPNIDIIKKQFEKVINYVIENELKVIVNPFKLFSDKLLGLGGSLCYDGGCGGFKRIFSFSTSGTYYPCDSFVDSSGFEVKQPSKKAFLEKRKKVLEKVSEVKQILGCEKCPYYGICRIPCVGKLNSFNYNKESMKRECGYNKMVMNILFEKITENPLNLFFLSGFKKTKATKKEVLQAYSRPSPKFKLK